jgi:hypothetical protein
MKAYVEAEAEESDVEEMEMTGCSATWLTRARLPLSGARPDGNLTDSWIVGVKESGMTDEGRRFALLSASTKEVAAMMRSFDSSTF